MLNNYNSSILVAFNSVVSNGLALNPTLLDSCFASTGYFDTIEEQIASVFRSIVKNHIFQDGNKRTAVLFLFDACNQNSTNLIVTDKQLFDIVIMVATTKIEVSEISTLLFG